MLYYIFVLIMGATMLAVGTSLVSVKRCLLPPIWRASAANCSVVSGCHAISTCVLAIHVFLALCCAICTVRSHHRKLELQCI
jgi:hypothetical protein